MGIFDRNRSGLSSPLNTTVTTGGGGGSSALSAITAATATNTIANANFAQVWNWDTLSTQSALKLSSTSITSGALLELSSSVNPGSNGANLLISVSTAQNTTRGIFVNNSSNNVNSRGILVSMGGASAAVVGLEVQGNNGAGSGVPTNILFSQSNTGANQNKGLVGTVASSNANTTAIDVSLTNTSATGSTIKSTHAGTGGYAFDGLVTGSGIREALRLQNTVAAANNSAVQITFAANRTTGGLTSVAGVAGQITDITNGAYKGALVFLVSDNAAPSERLRINEFGDLIITSTNTGTQTALIKTADASGATLTKNLTVTTGDYGGTTANPGDLTIQPGNFTNPASVGSAAELHLNSGDSGLAGGSGGMIFSRSGNATDGQGGGYQWTGGSGTTSTADNTWTTGSTTSGTSGQHIFTTGDSGDTNSGGFNFIAGAPGNGIYGDFIVWQAHYAHADNVNTLASVAEASAGTGATSGVTGTDCAGELTLTTGTGATIGLLATITFSHPWGVSPRVVITPINSATADLAIYIVTTATTLEIRSNSNPSDATVYKWNWFAIQS
jgi:hypothetical protein